MKAVYLCLQVTREGQASYAHVHEIVSGLRRRGWDVDLVEPVAPDSASLIRRAFAFCVVQLSVIRRLPRAEVLYVRSHPMTPPSVFAARLLGVPVVQEINGPFQDYYVAHPILRWTRRIVDAAARLSLRVSSAVIVVTPQLADWVREQARCRHVAVIPNGANDVLFHPKAAALRDLPKRRVVFFGAMAPWHGVADMLDAAQLPQWPNRVSLVLAGDGVEAESIRAAASRNPHIVYLGRLPYREVPSLVAGSVAGLVAITDPSGRSATGLSPIKLFETLACGTPVIATDFPFQSEFVRQNECGFVIPPSDPAALADAVARLAGDNALRERMGRAGREAVVQAHSWDCRAADTHDLLTRLTAGQGANAQAAAPLPHGREAA